MPGISTYSASKGALERWAESMSQEIAPFGLGVTILVTGTFKTEILTEQTPDYGDHNGPYAKVYEGIHTTGREFVDKNAAPPEKFALALSAAIDDDWAGCRGPVYHGTLTTGKFGSQNHKESDETPGAKCIEKCLVRKPKHRQPIHNNKA